MLKYLAVIMLGLSLVACNTVDGVGKDLEDGGKSIQKSSK